MHQSTQRRTCRVVFLVGCILPTLAVVAWATYERLPTTAAARLGVVERMLGIRVAAASVDTPIPGVVRCRDLQLANVETGEVVLTAALAHLHTEEPTPRVQLSGVTVAESQLTHLATSLHRTLEVDWPGSVSIELANVSWKDGGRSAASKLLAGRSLAITLESTEQSGAITGRRCTIDAGDNGPRVEVLRNRQMTPPTTRVELDTAGQPVPADWLVELGALVIDGGEVATFAGRVEVVHAADGTSGMLDGEFENVALAEALNVPLNAVASFQNLKLHWQAGRMVSAEGDVVAEAGSMPGGLAQTLKHLYQTPQPGAHVANEATLQFAWMGVTFRLADESLTLLPLSGAEQNACILGSNLQVLFGCPDRLAPTPYIGTVLTHFGGDRGTQAATRLPRTLQR
ncbi:hypothetical protein [Aeoliella sp.]|uniref:hypothetical protein n=1 Tax=Aeoliella sp. TaxID=2795800 RepID=UPI003CCC0631